MSEKEMEHMNSIYKKLKTIKFEIIIVSIALFVLGLLLVIFPTASQEIICKGIGVALTIDNTKKMVLEGLSEALHVSIEWLRGETDEYETDITDKKELQIRDAMGDILKQLPLDLSKKEDAFSKDLLLLMLKQYNLFLESFQFACKNYKGNTNEADIAKVMGFESNDEYNEIMFLREITHTVNAFNDMADIVRLYSKKPEMAEQRLENLLSEVLYEDSDSV